MISLGPFDLIAPIGKGGMAEVWSGVHRAQETAVAIKIMAGRGVSDARFLRAFRNEVRAVAGLDHPTIVTVFDHGEVTWEAEAASEGRMRSGSPYLVMERIEGGSLYPLCGKLPWLQLKAILLQLLDGLAHAHARGVIHRDLKPSNVMRDAANRAVKLTDFGIAHALDQEARGTAERAVLGTPSYMAPEQFSTDGRESGPWTDLYAIGCLSFALSCGDPPFGRTGNMDAFRAAHTKWPAPALTPQFPVPASFNSWVQRLLEKEPSRRYRMAADAAWELRNLEGGDEISSGIWSSGGDHDAEMTIVDPAGVLIDSQKWTETPTVRESPSNRTAEDTHRGQSTLSYALPPMPEHWHRLERSSSGASVLGVGLGLYGLRAIPVIDRERERDELWKALGYVRSNRECRVVLLEGSTGSGKSRLAEWLCERAHETGGALSLRAQHAKVDDGTDLLGQMLGRHLRCLGLDRARALRRIEGTLRANHVDDPDEWHALTEMVSPATDADLREGARVIRFTTAAERYALVRRNVERVCRERPVIIWLDDVQWGLDSLGFVQHLLDAQKDDPQPILVVMTTQEEALAEREAEPKVLERVLERSGSQRIHVAPLPPEHHTTLVRELLGLEDDLVARVAERTAGNPLFAVQLVGNWVERGLFEAAETGLRLRAGATIDLPENIHQVWAERIERVLSGRAEGDRVALEIAAILGQDVDAPEWREVCERAELDAPFSLVEELISQRLARAPTEGPYVRFSFVHGMLREALEQHAKDSGRAKAIHRACVEMLRGWSGRGVAERLGRHLIGAGEPEAALEPLLRGAEARYARGDYAVADLLLLERQRACEALGLAPSDVRWGETWTERSRAARIRGQSDLAATLAAQAEEAARVHGWPHVRARAIEEQGCIARFRGEVRLALDYLKDAERRYRDLPDEKSLARCQMVLGYALVESGRRDEATSRFQSALARHEQINDLYGEGGCLLGLAYVDRLTGRLPQALLHTERAKHVFDMGGYRAGVAHATNFLGDLSRLRGAFDAALAHYEAAHVLHRATGMGDVAFAPLNFGLTFAMRRDFEIGRRELETALVTMEQTDSIGYLAIVHAGLLSCAADADDWEAWSTHLERSSTYLRETGYKDVDIPTLARLAGDVAQERGHYERAQEAYEFAMTQWRALDRPDEVASIQAAIQALGVKSA